MQLPRAGTLRKCIHVCSSRVQTTIVLGPFQVGYYLRLDKGDFGDKPDDHRDQQEIADPLEEKAGQSFHLLLESYWLFHFVDLEEARGTFFADLVSFRSNTTKLYELARRTHMNTPSNRNSFPGCTSIANRVSSSRWWDSA